MNWKITKGGNVLRFVLKKVEFAIERKWESFYSSRCVAAGIVISFAWFVFPYAWTYHKLFIFNLWSFSRSFSHSLALSLSLSHSPFLSISLSTYLRRIKWTSMCKHPSGMKTTYHFLFLFFIYADTRATVCECVHVERSCAVENCRQAKSSLPLDCIYRV